MQKNVIGTIKSIPVSALVLSSRNVRKVRGPIEGLAASIKSQGLIHNLTVMPLNGSGKFEIVAGGQRWRALRHLIKNKELPKDHAVDCRIVAADMADEVSLSENVSRQDMHPADQFDAFKTLVERGMPIEDVAARFGVAPLVVKQRLKLANVSPSLVEKFRENEITLEQMMALAVTDDQEAQERVWKAARQPWQRQPNELRGALTETDVDATKDRRAKYVTLDAYEKAGGVVRRDLFGNGVYLSDAALLDRLTEEKLARAVARVRKEGWGWVEYRLQNDYAELHGFGRLAPKLREPTKKERRELEALAKQQLALEQECEQEITDDRVDEINDELRVIEERKAEIEAASEIDDVDSRMNAGALVILGYDGAAHVERGLVRRDARKRVSTENEESEDASETPPKADKPEFSDALTRRLTAERTLALRASLAAQPGNALIALVHALVLREFYDDEQTALDIWVRDEAHLQQRAGNLDETKAAHALHALRTELQAALPTEPSDLWVWVIEQSQFTQLRYLAYCIAPSVNAVQDRANSDHTYTQRPIAASHALAALLCFDMSDWWQATPENYFGSVSKAKLSEAVRETKGDDAAEKLDKLKKTDAVTVAAVELEGTRWLPSLLRAM